MQPNPSQHFVNANDVLPPNLVAELQEHISAVYCWVPSRRMQAARARARRVVELHGNGRDVRAIAGDVGLTKRRVHQILQAQRQGVQS